MSTVCRRESLTDPSKTDVVNCIIYHRPTGYGFADPYFIYETLTELVMHYRRESLAAHNEQLNLTLMYPVNATPDANYGTYATSDESNTYIMNFPKPNMLP